MIENCGEYVQSSNNIHNERIGSYRRKKYDNRNGETAGCQQPSLSVRQSVRARNLMQTNQLVPTYLVQILSEIFFLLETPQEFENSGKSFMTFKLMKTIGGGGEG